MNHPRLLDRRNRCLVVWGTAVMVLIGVVALAPAGHGMAAQSGSPTGHDAPTLTPVIQSVPSPPRWYRGDDGRFHMNYELLLTNTVPLPVDVTDLQVRDERGRSVENLSGDPLQAAMSLLGNETEPTTQLPASSVGVVWLDLSFETREQIPTKVVHQLTVDVGAGLPVGPSITSTGARARTSRAGAITIGAPLRGGPWVAVVGPHRRALQAINGALHLGQRYAIDFSAKLDGDNRTHVGDPDQNASYFNYGQQVVAVAAGTVVEAVDGLPDQIPNNKVAVPTADQDGNHVILRLDRGVFAGYAHLRPGSGRVRKGDRVRAGQILGELGNSGNSGGPHLHFQLMNRPSLLNADGLPFVLRRFELEGLTTSLDAFLDADMTGASVPIDTTAAGTRRDQGLTGLEVLRFADRRASSRGS